jgi:hypothetical protein
MRKTSTLFLKAVVILIATLTLVGLLWFPLLEGRSVGQDLTTIYLGDPLILYGFAASIPFFIALYQALKLLGFVEKNKAFSQDSVRTLRNIKCCAVIQACLIVGAMIFVVLVAEEDPAGVVALGIYATFATIVIATATAIFERLLQNAVDLKSENDLTV